MSPPGDDDKNRKAILARRARFMAAALAATGCEKPQPCLSVSPVQRFLPDGGLASPDHGDQGGQPTKPPPELPPDVPPRVCLSPRPPPPEVPPAEPQPCLKILRRDLLEPKPAQPAPAPDAGSNEEAK